MELIWQRLAVFFLSMVPVIELRGAIPLGFGFELPLWETLVLSILGNTAIIPLVIPLFTVIINWLKKIRLTSKFAYWVENRAKKNSKKVESFVFIGLMLFVAIPLPGTGAWTAATIAGLTEMKVSKAFFPIALGVLIAAGIVTAITYGVVTVFL